MSGSERQGPGLTRVVFAPDVLAAGLFGLGADLLFERWRDGRLRPVTNRDLLRFYLRILSRLGLGEELLGRWARWLTSADTAVYLEQLEAPGEGIGSLCDRIAREGAADCVVHAGMLGDLLPSDVADGVVWVTFEQFLARRV